ncbi:MAG TPA: aminotransferase class IV, partial [Solirubrobacteraceae bacterium]|nr:aminotransferase class IV [Solirubrobacteraceae bacterium]
MFLACLDGAVLPAAEARVPATDPGLLRGDGVFEVVRLYDGRPFAFDEHLDRMRRSARNLRLPFDPEEFRPDVAGLLEAAGHPDALLRLVATRGGRRLALIEPLPDHPPSVRLAAVTYAPPRLLDGIKSLSYAANMLATRLAQERGCDEALLVTPHGRVLEGPTSTLFYVSGGELLTPPLDDHVLDSITRRLILQDCRGR